MQEVLNKDCLNELNGCTEKEDQKAALTAPLHPHGAWRRTVWTHLSGLGGRNKGRFSRFMQPGICAIQNMHH